MFLRVGQLSSAHSFLLRSPKSFRIALRRRDFSSRSLANRHQLSPRFVSKSWITSSRKQNIFFPTSRFQNLFGTCNPLRLCTTSTSTKPDTTQNSLSVYESLKLSTLIEFDYMWVNFYSWFIATFTHGELSEVLNVWALFEVIDDYALLILGSIFNFDRLTYTQAENIKYFVVFVLFCALFF